MNDGIFKSDFMVLKSNCNNNMQLWGLIKKFVDWCSEINLLSYAYKFWKEYETTNVLSDVKISARYIDN